MRSMRYQPQGRLRLNTRNPLTKGLIFLAPMIGGHDLVNIVGGTRAAAAAVPGTVGNARGKFASFTGSHNVDFPGLSIPLNSNQPASIGWIQQPIGASGYHALLQLKARDAAAPFLIYQSPSDANYYFAAGIRSTSVSAFGSSTGPLTNEKIDTFVLTAANGIGGNATTGLSLFRGAQKFAPSGSPFLSSSSASAVSIGHRDGGADPWRGLIGCVAVWDRVLTDAEAASFNANPWQLFAARDVDETAALAAPVNRTLIVTPAALLLGGGEAAMRAERRVTTQPSSLAIGGGSIALRSARKLGVQLAALGLTPGEAALRTVRQLAVQPGVTSLAAGEAGLIAARRVSASPASMALQSGDVRLLGSRRLTVAPVAMTAAGGFAQFAYTPAPSAGSYVMAVTSGALSLTSGTVGMRVTRRVVVAPAALAVSAGGARWLAGYRMAVAPVALAMSGGQVLMGAARRLQVDPAQLVAAGGVVTLRYSQQIEYARAPAGSGYSPQRVEAQARPAQIGSFRPASIQRNER